MTTISNSLSPILFQALETVSVDSDGCHAVVEGRELDAKNPRDLQAKLGATLYEVLHAGRPPHEGNRPRSLRDHQLESRLADVMPHQETLTNGRLIGESEGGDCVVEYKGLRIRVPEALTAGASAETTAVSLRLPAARPAISPGFFLTDSSLGAMSARPLLRIYVHLKHPDAAVEAWGRILSRLETANRVYRAKVASSPRFLPRRDALVVYLGPESWQAAGLIVEAVEGVAGLGVDTSPFTHRLAVGVSAAWEPQDTRPGMQGLSFGQHRAGNLAEALVYHAQTRSGMSRDAAIMEAFMTAGIDPAEPARNLDSPSFP